MVDFAGAEELNEEALAIFRRLGDRKGISHVLNNMAAMAIDQGNWSAARPLLDESMGIRAELGDQHGAALVMTNLGLVAHDLKNYGEARSLFERGLAILRTLGSQRNIAMTSINLSGVLREVEDYPSAEATLKAALLISGEVADRLLIATCLEEFAALAAAMAQLRGAAVLWGRAERLREEIMSPLPDRPKAIVDRQVAAARHAVGDDAVFDSAWREGRDKPLEQVMKALLKRRLELEG